MTLRFLIKSCAFMANPLLSIVYFFFWPKKAKVNKQGNYVHLVELGEPSYFITFK